MVVQRKEDILSKLTTEIPRNTIRQLENVAARNTSNKGNSRSIQRKEGGNLASENFR